MRLVLDTNVLVGATLNRTGAPRRLLDSWRVAGGYELVVSQSLVDELEDVVRRPKLAVIVSGDRDLFDLEDPPVPIWTVAEALERLA